MAVEIVRLQAKLRRLSEADLSRIAAMPPANQYAARLQAHSTALVAERRLGRISAPSHLNAEESARRAQETGDEYDELVAGAMALMAKKEYHAAAKAWRKVIKVRPDEYDAYLSLGMTLLHRPNHDLSHDRARDVEALEMFLLAMELSEDGTELWGWAAAVAGAFEVLDKIDCDGMPKPKWWNDEALKVLSVRVVAAVPNLTMACGIRARVLSGNTLMHISSAHSSCEWNAGPRTSRELKEAATWFRRAASGYARDSPSSKLACERLACACDASANRLLAEEEAGAAAARKVAEAWSRLRAHALFVGRLAVFVRRLHDKVCRRRDREAAKLARATAPRRCKECGDSKPQEAYSQSQWTKGGGKRTCTACQDVAKAEEQRKKDEAARKEMEELLEAECVVCYREMVTPDDRAIFECTHWICRGCASEMHLRNELHSCPHCRHVITNPQQHVMVCP